MINHLANSGANLANHCRAFGLEGGFHLHCFEHHQHIARLNLLAFGHRQLDDLARHRRGYFRSCQPMRASSATSLNRNKFKLRRADRHPNRAAPARAEDPRRPVADSNNSAFGRR